MKEYFLLLAKYNRDADDKVLKIMEGMTEEERLTDRNGFFKSIYGTLDHVAAVDVMYQGLLKTALPDVKGLNHKYSGYRIDFGKTNFPEFDLLKEALKILDDAFVEIVASINDEDLAKIMTVNTPRGEMKVQLGIFLLRYINHGTHHRGQISQMLDALKIDNNFSGIADSYK